MTITREEYGDLYTKHSQHTYKVLRRRGLSHDLATEFTQEGWARGWEKIDQFRGDSKIENWVVSISIRRFLMYLRKKFVGLEDVPEIELAVNHSEEKLNSRVDTEKFMNLLDPKSQQILILRYIEGYESKEAAHISGLNENTLKVKILRARRHITG